MTLESDAAVLKDFAFLQARPNLIFSRPRTRPAAGGHGTTQALAPLRYADSVALTLGDDLHEPLEQLQYPDGTTSSPAGLLHTLLQGSDGYQRFEASNNFNAHRGIPSAQCLFPTELFLCTEQGNWHYDPAAHQLRQVGTSFGENPPVSAGLTTALVIAARPGKLPDYYRELQWALSLCEAGHLIELVMTMATALGMAPRLRTDFDDQALLMRLGSQDGDAWLPAAIIDLGTSDLVASAAGDAWEAPDDPVLRADRMGWQQAPTGPVTPWHVGAGSEVELPAEATPSISWAKLLFERSSGRGTGGFGAAPEVMSTQELADVLLKSRETALGTWSDAEGQGSVSGQGMLVVVERVNDLEDGLYEWPLGGGPLLLRRPGRFLAEVQESFFYPQTVTRVDSCNFALLMVLDYDAISTARGARGLRISQLELGAIAQSGAQAIAAHGGFLRPCRSFDADRLATFTGLSGGQTVAYLCLGGKSRFTDLLLDLRP